MLADKVTPEKESQRDWVGILPVAFIFVFLFVTFLPLSGWISGSAGIEKAWITSASILLSSAVSILAILASCFGGRFLPRLFCSNRAGR
jgi:apolipoprotein N-acyltransferase